MGNRPPRVTFVVPCFNESSELIRESLASLRAQSFTDFECVVIDESTQPQLATACRTECALDVRFIYLHPSERLGLAASLNLGIARSCSEFVARFDSDDICLPDRVAQQVDFLDANSDIGVLGGALEIINKEGRTTAVRQYPTDPDAIERRMQFTNAIAHPTVMARRTVFEQHGFYDPAFRFSEDLELWLRWLNAGVKVSNLPQTLVRYRQDSTNRSGTHWRYNLRARLRHFSVRLLVLRVAGIAVILCWMAIPANLKNWLFRKVIFRRHAQA